MKILVSGASGLIGSALLPALRVGGDEVSQLVRRASNDSNTEVSWDPSHLISPDVMSQYDAVVHLAARTIGTRWTEKVKREARESRVGGTTSIAQSMAAAFRNAGRPTVLISAAAIGYYGSRGDEVLTESSSPGAGFLADLSQEWEESTRSASDAGIRVVMPRISMVLSKQGGGLPRMVTPFKLGLGGRVGTGRQWMSWIALPDVIAGIRFALKTPTLSGPVNLTSPQPVRNSEFVKTLAAVLHRPAIFPLPATAVRLMMGEMGEALLLGSSCVVPNRLEAAGFKFRYPELRQALQAILKPE